MNTTKSILLLGACAAFILAAPGAFAEGKAHAGKANHGAARAAQAQERAAERKAKAEERKAQAAERKAKAKAAAEENKAKAEERKKDVEAKKAAAEQKKAELEKKKTEAQAKKAEKDGQRSEKSNEVTENRQTRQEKRIEQGVKKGYLTPDEIAKLNTQQKNIESMQQQFNGDGKITRDESKQLRSALNDASLDIWTEKHDTDGKQMPVYRLGKDVRLNADVAAKLANDNLSKADARKFLGDFHALVDLKKKLNGSLSDAERTTLQAHYNQMLGQYFSTVQ